MFRSLAETNADMFLAPGRRADHVRVTAMSSPSRACRADNPSIEKEIGWKRAAAEAAAVFAASAGTSRHLAKSC